MLRLLSSVLGVACALLAPAASAATETTATDVLPPDFAITGTHGYKGFVSVAGGEYSRTVLVLSLVNRDRGANYIAPVDYTENSIEAKLGPLGEIDLHAVPTGHPVTGHSNCDGGGKPYTVGSGRWEGKIRFRGEEGFTSVEATSAKADLEPFLRSFCGGPKESSEGSGGHSPGALLAVRRGLRPEEIELTVRKNKRVGPTRIGASLSEKRGKIKIDREVRAVDPSKAFSFEIPPGTATVKPTAPFSGSLDFSRASSGAPKVTGDLKVDFPGRANFPLLGPGKLRASLERAVLNPSHPF